VTIKFTRPVSFMAFDPETARRIARELVERAKEVERRRLQ
jgi:hypothetical protein